MNDHRYNRQNNRYVQPVIRSRMPDEDPYERYRYEKKHSHRVLWSMLFVFSLLCTAAIVLLMVPQMIPDLTIPGIPSFAFYNGRIITLNQETYAAFRSNARYADTDLIYPGISVDGVDIGGLTIDQAISRVDAVHTEEAGQLFNITLQVNDMTWNISSANIPVMRNTDEIVRQAHALGRGNTPGLRAQGKTPIRERLEAIAALSRNPVSLATEMTYDKNAILTFTKAVAEYIRKDPVNANVASFDFDTRAFTFTDESSGLWLDAKEAADAVIACIDSGDTRATVIAEIEEVLPEYTKAYLQSRFGKVSSYTTKTTSDKNRNTNINLSSRAVNGTTVMPGETFSFNKATGERTEKKGYKEAGAISGGKTIDETGGGVCQTSSTLFNAVARANLTIVKRSPHAWPSSYVEKGMDATVDWPNLDFKFSNDTDWPVFLIMYYADRKVTAEVYGMTLGSGITIDLYSRVTKTIEAPEGTKMVLNPSLPIGTREQTVKARKGYEVTTEKVWYQNGTEIRREVLCKSTYKAYQATIEYNDGSGN